MSDQNIAPKADLGLYDNQISLNYIDIKPQLASDGSFSSLNRTVRIRLKTPLIRIYNIINMTILKFRAKITV